MKKRISVHEHKEGTEDVEEAAVEETVESKDIGMESEKEAVV